MYGLTDFTYREKMDTISVKLKGERRVQDNSQMTATNIILEKKYIFKERRGSNV